MSEIDDVLLDIRQMFELANERIEKLIPDEKDHIGIMLLCQEIGNIINKTPMEVYPILRLLLDEKEEMEQIIIKKGRFGGVYKAIQEENK